MDGPDEARYPLLSALRGPAELKALPLERCADLADELRAFIVDSVTRTGGHLGSNLGAVEVTIALHRVFSSPQDVVLFDTGHQAYVHKLLTGRAGGFAHLREEGGLSGYPSRAESEHDWIENSHASTALSYAHGFATAFARSGEDAHRRVVALVGDGALTGGMAYEAMNNLGAAGARVCIVLNDNGRSYAPTVSKLSESLTQLRLSPSFGALRARVGKVLEEIPGVGQMAGHSLRSLTSALRELVEPHVFFEALGIRYTGPVNGHDVATLEQALSRAASFPGPIVLHVLTRKGKGYAPAEADEVQCLHDLKATAPLAAPGSGRDQGALAIGPRSIEASYTEAFGQAVLERARADDTVVAITAAMPGPTGLLAFEAAFPERFVDVGIAEAHAMTAAAGMALAGLRPVVALYSTFLSRCFDSENLDVGLHGAPVVICADRAGITGDDGPSHHGVLDIVLGLAVPGLTIFAPSEPAEIAPMLEAALGLEGPSLIRYPKTPCPQSLAAPGSGLASRELRAGAGEVVLVGVGKMAARCLDAAALLEREGIDATVLDPRVVRPLDPALVERCVGAALVVSVEDGLAHGGAGQHLAAVLDDDARQTRTLGPRVVTLGVPTRYLAHAKPDAILARLGLDAAGIAASTLAEIERVARTPARGVSRRPAATAEGRPGG
ncbi:MAG TPA: 1-deoxy-D-xylulose-5-phosphate synthase, partial [Acidimicrobiales bacterium]|nr:1-deoxy-D-xylulose-5-phosphate synthase [Acidimicrobiales bacterium]